MTNLNRSISLHIENWIVSRFLCLTVSAIQISLGIDRVGSFLHGSATVFAVSTNLVILMPHWHRTSDLDLRSNYKVRGEELKHGDGGDVWVRIRYRSSGGNSGRSTRFRSNGNGTNQQKNPDFDRLKKENMESKRMNGDIETADEEDEGAAFWWTQCENDGIDS